MNTGNPRALNAECFTNDQSTHFECRTRRAVRAGEEVCVLEKCWSLLLSLILFFFSLCLFAAQHQQLLVSYKADAVPLDNHHLLMDYGFVLDDVDARTAATIARPIPQNDPHRAARMKVLSRLKMQP